ncbi:MAG TPA: DNA-3-methyladenine glycosylase [Terriglobales bacterium]|nr:DNA-3-methyladenine glycosylase [Terriglobales bacterium]
MRCSYKPLPRSFFNRPPDVVAPELLGKLLVRRIAGDDSEGMVAAREMRVRIAECEAYLGEGDAAAHAARGMTPRNAVLFGPPGHAYIYFIYGMHWCVNVSTLPKGRAGGVLLRAARWLAPGEGLLRGPGLLTRALGIDARLRGHDMTRPGALFLADDGFRPTHVLASPRVGIRQATELPLRFRTTVP